MNLSEIGKNLTEQICKTPQMRPDMGIDIPSFVVMPDHVHLIIIIRNHCDDTDATHCNDGTDAMHCVQTTTDATHCVQTATTDAMHCVQIQKNQFAPQSKNLASVVRGIKIGTTTFARKNNLPFAWQSRYHDHIIRNQNEMNRIATYIENNVANWGNKHNKQRHN